MAIGERIRFFRSMKGITQKYLGLMMGFPERSADVRMAQYETGSRTPKADLTRALAGYFGISPDALTVPDIDSDIGLMHTLFTLEDLRGLTIGEIDGELCLRLDKSRGSTYFDMYQMLSPWLKEAAKLKAGEITKEDYDHWRYTYPAVEAQRTRDRLDALCAKDKLDAQHAAESKTEE